MTAREIIARTAETVTLRSGAPIQVRSSNFRGVRGVTCAAAVIDEACFLRDEESTVPDLELYRALLPALATTRGRLLAISSPWAKRGLMYAKWRRHFGKNGDTLVWVARSVRMNPTLDAAMIAEAMADDPVAARSEWQGGWREDVAPFLSADMVEAVVVRGRFELAYRENVSYTAFLDPSGGAQDSFTCAIAHAEEQDGHTVAVVDVLRERRPPFDPADVAHGYSALLASYGVCHVQADKYAGAWVVSAFAEHGIHVEQSAAPKSELYLSLHPLIASRRVELLDNARLINQLVNQLVALERRVARGGRDSVDHPPHHHDDVANVASGALRAAGQPAGVCMAQIGTGCQYECAESVTERLNPDAIRNDSGSLELTGVGRIRASGSGCQSLGRRAQHRPAAWSNFPFSVVFTTIVSSPLGKRAAGSGWKRIGRPCARAVPVTVPRNSRHKARWRSQVRSSHAECSAT